MPGMLWADDMGLRKTFTCWAAGMLFNWLTEEITVGLLPTNVWQNNLTKLVHMALKDYSGIISEEQVWYPL